jgi:F-type H+-transporting ATPase subunit delta
VAAQKSELGGLAQRYATALFDLAGEKGQLDAIASDLTQLRAMIDASADLRRLISSPLLGREDQGRAMAAIAEAAGFGDLTRRFLGLVAQNRRLFVLPGIIKAYHAMLADRRGEQTAQVTAARALTPAQQGALAEVVRRMVGGKISIEVLRSPEAVIV